MSSISDDVHVVQQWHEGCH